MCFILVAGLLCFFSGMTVIRENLLISGISFAERMKKECSYAESKELFLDVSCFPVQEKGSVSFENGYGDGRSYGGKRKHEGIDVIPDKEKDNYYKIVSVSDGIVEQMGWLELGGYRIGIRSDRGFYYYYAHLSSYADGIRKGQKIKAGDVLGYMGNTGYGKEGTKGKFIIHLHFGIYHRVQGKEKSLNPYFLLQFLS